MIFIFGKNALPLWNIPTCSFPVPLLFLIHHVSALYQLLCGDTHLILLPCSRATMGAGVLPRHRAEHFLHQNSCKGY